MAGRLVIARSAYCCLHIPASSVPTEVQRSGKSIPEAISRFCEEKTNMILLLHNLVVSQIAISLIQGFISWRGFIHCHVLLTRYVYMYVYMYLIEMYHT